MGSEPRSVERGTGKWYVVGRIVVRYEDEEGVILVTGEPDESKGGRGC